MNISRAARHCGLPVKTIRYYEEIDLIRPGRALNGYRDFSERDIHKLRFLKRARGLGFKIDDCRRLLSLYEDKGRASGEVKSLASAHLGRIEEKLRELRELRDVLGILIESCHGDHRADCPILDDLSGAATWT